MMILRWIFHMHARQTDVLEHYPTYWVLLEEDVQRPDRPGEDFARA